MQGRDLSSAANESKFNSDLVILAFEDPALFSVILKDCKPAEIAQLIIAAYGAYPSYLHSIIGGNKHKDLLLALIHLANANQEVANAINIALLIRNKNDETPLHILFKIFKIKTHHEVTRDIISLATPDTINQIVLIQEKQEKNTILHVAFKNVDKENCLALLQKINDEMLNKVFLHKDISGRTLSIIRDGIFSACISRLQDKIIQVSFAIKTSERVNVISHGLMNLQSAELLKLIQYASRALVDESLGRSYSSDSNLKIIFTLFQAEVSAAIIQKCSSEAIYKNMGSIEWHSAIKNFSEPLFFNLINKDPFRFAKEFYKHFSPGSYKSTKPGVQTLLSKTVWLTEPFPKEQVPAFMEFIEKLMPNDHTKVLEPEKWLVILLPALKILRQNSPLRNKLLTMIGRVHFSPKNKHKNNKKLALETWLAIDSPADLSLKDNFLIGDFFRLQANITTDLTLSNQLKSKSLRHLHFAIKQQNAAKVEPSAAFLTIAVKDSQSEKGIDFDAKEVDDDSLVAEVSEFNDRNKKAYEEQLADHTAEFVKYLKKRKNETRHYFRFFGYSENDYKVRRSVYYGLITATDWEAKKVILTNALKNKSIINGYRHQCADIITKILMDIEGLIQAQANPVPTIPQIL